MSRIYDKLMQELQSGVTRKRASNKPFDLLVKTLTSEGIDWVAGAEKRRAEQSTVGNTVLYQGNQVIQSLVNRDGSMTNEQITNAKAKIDSLRDDYIDRYPDAINTIDSSYERLDNMLGDYSEQNAAFEDVQSGLDSVLQSERDENSLKQMYNQLSQMSEGDLSATKEQYLKQLSNMSSFLIDAEDKMYEFGLTKRVGARKLLDKKKRADEIIKTFSNQFLLLDEQSSFPVLDGGEREMLRYTLENDDFSLLKEHNVAKRADVMEQESQIERQIQQSVVNWTLLQNEYSKFLADNPEYENLSDSEKEAYDAESIMLPEIDKLKGWARRTPREEGEEAPVKGMSEEISPRDLEEEINWLESNMRRYNKTYATGRAGTGFYNVKKFTDAGDLISENETLRRIFEVDDDEPSFNLEPSDDNNFNNFMNNKSSRAQGTTVNPSQQIYSDYTVGGKGGPYGMLGLKGDDEKPSSSPITPEIGSPRYKQQNQGSEYKTTEFMDEILNLEPATPGSNMPYKKDFDEKTKGLDPKRKSLLTKIYRQNKLLQNMDIRIGNILYGKTDSKPSQSRLKSLNSQREKINSRLEELVSQWENN